MDQPRSLPHKPRAADASERATPGCTEEWERRYRALLEQTSDAVFVAGAPERRLLWANDAACRITGYSRDELLALRLDDLLGPGKAEAVPPELPSHPNIAATHVERTLRGKDGLPIRVTLSARLLEDGTEQVVAHDLTEFRAVIDSLRSSEAEMRALFGAMTDLIFVFDREGVYRKVGPTSPELLYQPAEFVLGRSLHQILPGKLA